MTRKNVVKTGRRFHLLLVCIALLGQGASTTPTPRRKLSSGHPSLTVRHKSRLVRCIHPLGLGLCLVMCLFALTGCLSSSLTSLQILPASGTTSVAAGQTSQFQAVATYTKSGHASSTKDVTSQVAWKSSSSSVATISTAGLATAVSAGTVSITASIEGQFGSVVGTSDMAVTAGPAAPLPRTLATLVVIPASQTVTTTNETAQFIAIGTYGSGSPLTQDLTNQVSWQSSDVKVAQVNASGLVTGIGLGTVTITVLATDTDGTVVPATSTVTSGPSVGPVLLPTLTIFKVGTGTGTVTGNEVINCGPEPGCIGNFTQGTVVTLVAVADQGSVFDGWSANCTPVLGVRTSCTITMNNNQTVGAIFDPSNP
jgi:hypothetical protein